MITKEFEGMKFSSLGMGAMRLPVLKNVYADMIRCCQ